MEKATSLFLLHNHVIINAIFLITNIVIYEVVYTMFWCSASCLHYDTLKVLVCNFLNSSSMSFFGS